MQVEVVFALLDKQVLRAIQLPAGATVAEAIEASDIAEHFPDMDLGKLQAGVWGKRVERDCVLRHGDRVELYRPLDVDPRKARRLRAEA